MSRARLRLRDLPAATRVAIRSLHRHNPWWNLQIVALLGVWIVCGIVAMNLPLLPLRLACYFLIGATLQGLVIMMHEAVHGILFRKAWLNRWIGFLCGLPAGLSVSAYRVGHLPHHRYERDPRDPDELENFTRDPRLLSALFAFMCLAGDLFGLYRVGPVNMFHGKPHERRAVLVEYLLIVVTFVVAFRLIPIAVMLQVWIFPALFARQLTNVRTLAEHVLTDHDHPMSPTRTVVSNRFVSWFMCNLNYHIEHHLYPAVPWYNLPQLHALLREHLVASGAQVYGSYTRFLIDLGRFMMRAWRPGGRLLPLVLPLSTS